MPGQPWYAVLRYAGGGFAGWQSQRSARTVQGDVEAVLHRLSGQRVAVHAAGRTDRGVHALAQVVTFSLPRSWECDSLHRALNALLPGDVWALEVAPAIPAFHARRDAVARRYRYVVGCDSGSRSPFRHPYEWALRKPLDAPALHHAAASLVGTHDFRAFASVGQQKQHYRCAVTHAEWQARSDHEGFIFSIEADRFLHRMVRFLVGTMVDIGLERRPVADLPRLLAAAGNRDTSPPAPPDGLYLVGVRYPHFAKGIVA